VCSLFQELALYLEFTIEETLSYFGRLHALGREEIAKQTEFLTQFLDLPKKTRTNKTLR
jgi:ABC-type Na+ transport system ATPase subunit NatA